MASAANLLVGSTCGDVYIIRCDPNHGTVKLKTTITAGTRPVQLLVDVPNKCFYCLDTTTEGQEGQLLTLAPTELGSIESIMSIGTGGKGPMHMMNVGKTILVTHVDGYSVIESPIAPKSTRRRRTSTLSPVTEDTVAESLDQLYTISKAMGDDSATTTTADPAPAIAAIEAHLWSDTQVAKTVLQSFVTTTESPTRKFVEWDRGGEFVVGMTKESVTSYAISSSGQLSTLKSMNLSNVVDIETANGALFVLCKGELHQGKVISGELNLPRTISLDTKDEVCISVLKNGSRAFVLTKTSIVSIIMRSEEMTTLNIVGTSMTLAHDDAMLFVANAAADTVSMYSLDGGLLGSCNVASPASIIHMS